MAEGWADIARRQTGVNATDRDTGQWSAQACAIWGLNSPRVCWGLSPGGLKKLLEFLGAVFGSELRVQRMRFKCIEPVPMS